MSGISFLTFLKQVNCLVIKSVFFVVLNNPNCMCSILFCFPCSVVDCGDPGNPQNGRRILPGGTTFQSNVTYECNTGFRLEGVAFQTCRALGVWSDSQPSCNCK